MKASPIGSTQPLNAPKGNDQGSAEDVLELAFKRPRRRLALARLKAKKLAPGQKNLPRIAGNLTSGDYLVVLAGRAPLGRELLSLTLEYYQSIK